MTLRQRRPVKAAARNGAPRGSIPAWLGIFALLAVFIAPPISQSLMRHEYTPAAHAQHSHSQTVTHHHPGSDAEAHGAAMQHMPSGAADEHAACGYCVLFSTVPLLTFTHISSVAALFLPAERQRVAFVGASLAQASYLPQRPRAPPVHDNALRHA